MRIAKLIAAGVLGGGAAEEVPWYLSGGVDPASVSAVYQPWGAADYAASLVNIANPGTNNAAEGVAPGWSAAGWVFNGSDDYLIGPSVNGTAATIITRTFYDANDDGVVVGYKGTDWSNKFKIYQDAWWSKLRFDWGAGAGSYSPDEVNYIGTHNIAALSTAHCYINGVEQVFTPTNPPTNFSQAAFIGASNEIGSPGLYIRIGVEMVAFYNAILTSDQIAAIGNAWLDFI